MLTKNVVVLLAISSLAVSLAACSSPIAPAAPISEPTPVVTVPPTEEAPAVPEDEVAPPSDDDATATSTGLTLSTASDACIAHGLEGYPAGFDVLWKSGKISEEVDKADANLQYAVDLTNADGTVTQAGMRCTVTGTDEAPEITNFELSAVG